MNWTELNWTELPIAAASCDVRGEFSINIKWNYSTNYVKIRESITHFVLLLSLI